MSTGPKTPPGKQRSSLNALKHGLTARDNVILGESEEAYKAFRDDMWKTWKPEGTAEEFCVARLVTEGWRLPRGARIETAIFINEARRRSDSVVAPPRRSRVSRTSQVLYGYVKPGEEEQEKAIAPPSEQEIEEAPLRELAEIYTGGAAEELRKLDRHEAAIYRRYQAALYDLLSLQKKRLG
jgi:hypothetical protein